MKKSSIVLRYRIRGVKEEMPYRGGGGLSLEYRKQANGGILHLGWYQTFFCRTFASQVDLPYGRRWPLWHFRRKKFSTPFLVLRACYDCLSLRLPDLSPIMYLIELEPLLNKDLLDIPP